MCIVPFFYELIAQRKTQINQVWMHSQWLFTTVLILHEVIPEKARVVVICLSQNLYAAWVVVARPVYFRYLVIYTQYIYKHNDDDNNLICFCLHCGCTNVFANGLIYPSNGNLAIYLIWIWWLLMAKSCNRFVGLGNIPVLIPKIGKLWGMFPILSGILQYFKSLSML